MSPVPPPSPPSPLAVSDVDYRVVGLSPQYWSHAPLLIGDLVDLPLVNGVDCLVVAPRGSDDDGNDEDDDDGNGDGNGNGNGTKERKKGTAGRAGEASGRSAWRVLPLSRVALRGVATAVDARADGRTTIVLDDGTGLVDCVFWDDCSRGGDDAFDLPPLLDEHRRRKIRVGDALEVLGKIRALTAGEARGRWPLPVEEDSTSPPLEVRFGCVREIRATSVCVIGEGRSRAVNRWNGEMVHWLKCMDFVRKSSTVRNGRDVLPLLGEAITSSILGKEGSSDGLSTEWGHNKDNALARRCCQTHRRFREALFYCHCEATLEALDAKFRFRDALLNQLLDAEDQLRSLRDSAHTTATEDCMDLLGAGPDELPPPLMFTFGSVCDDEELKSVALEVIGSENSQEAIDARRLVRRTFAAMTNDGILSMYDAEADLYLLVSRERVIEPFLRRCKPMGGTASGPSIQRPFFMRGVPKKRLAIIAASIEDRRLGATPNL